MEGVIDRYAYALLTLAHAEGAAKLHLITEIVFSDQILKLFYYLTRTLDVAGASDTNCNFKHDILPHNYNEFRGRGGSKPPPYEYEFLLLVINDADPGHKERALLLVALNRL